MGLAWPTFPKKKMFGKKDPEFIEERRVNMEFYFNEIFSEKRTDIVGSRRVMGEFYAYCRDAAATEADKARVINLINVTTVPKQDKKNPNNNRITSAISSSGSIIVPNT